MGSLKDEVYENLDYLSRLTEVMISPQNEILSNIKDRIDLTLKEVNAIKERSWQSNECFNIELYSVLKYVLKPEQTKYLYDLKPHFQLQVSDDFEIDFFNKKMSGTISLVKTCHQIEEKELLKIAVNKANCNLRQYKWPHKNLQSKLIAVLNVFEPEYGTKWAKTVPGKISLAGKHEIEKQISRVILENEWRLRNEETIIKMGEWIDSYLCDQDGAGTGLANLIKLKMMVNKDLPVYSINTVEVKDTCFPF
jgi:hypothetical protein